MGQNPKARVSRALLDPQTPYTSRKVKNKQLVIHHFHVKSFLFMDAYTFVHFHSTQAVRLGNIKRHPYPP
jgi:hypothetical protein